MLSSPRSRRLRAATTITRAVLVLATAATSLALVHEPADAAAVTRLDGRDRVATSVAVATAGWDTAPHVLLATATDYPDAVAAAALAARTQAPVLLTMPGELSPAVREAVGSLQVERVTVLGGWNAVATKVDRQLRELGLSVDRVTGSDRFDTAAAIARQVAADGTGPVVALALGSRTDGRDAWPDALSAATLAGLDTPVPTLLSNQTAIPEATLDALDELSPERVVVLGGRAAIADSVLEKIRDLGIRPVRAEGPTRYGTAVSVALKALAGVDEQSGPLDADQAVFVSGEDFPDALAAGALAARRSAPLLLVPGGRLADRVDGFLRDDGTPVARGVVVGGDNAVDDFVIEEIDAALTDRPRPTPPPACDLAYSSPDCGYRYEHPVSTWDRLAQCESGGNWAINTGNGYYGGIQFSLGSWQAVGGRSYPHQNTKWEQIHRGELLHDRQGWGAWPACSRKLGLR